MQTKLAETDQMTVEEFLAFYDSRPSGERWELIEGVAVMSPSPTQWHQTIAGNLVIELGNHKIKHGSPWLPIIGVSTVVPVSPRSLPQPDVYVQSGIAQDNPVTDDALVIFEVLSRSNKKADRDWRKRVYSSVPNCQHYVTISLKTAEVIRYDRGDSWQGEKLHGLDSALGLSAIDVTIPLSIIYRWTPIK
jgi:Uma2 family endonuclease